MILGHFVYPSRHGGGRLEKDGWCPRPHPHALQATDVTDRFTFACPHCASTNLTWDAITRWNIATQTNVVVTLLDTGSCEDCCAEIKQAEQVPLDAERDA
jgi:hypothetical protein